MGWLAFDNIDEALQDSKEILLPFNFKTWGLFAIIILLSGYFAVSFPGIPGGGFGTTPDAGMETDSVAETSFTNNFVMQSGLNPGDFTGAFQQSSMDASLFLLAGAGIIGLVTALLFITSVFHFVMYRSVKDKEPQIGLAREYISEGFQFFLYRVTTFLALLLGLGILALPLIVSLWTGLAIIPLAILLLIGFAVLDWIVIHLVLPDMIYSEKGLIQAFRSSLEVVQNQFREVAVFWLTKWVIGIVLGIGVSMVLISGLVLLALPFIVIGGLMYLAGLTGLWSLPVAIVYGLMAFVAVLYAAVPVRVFIFSYILNMYEDLFQ